MEAVLEGILFVVGNEGITKDKLLDVLELTSEELEELIKKLSTEYQKDTRGLDIEVYSDKLKLVTKKEHKKYYEKLVEKEKNEDLSQAALETLAIIAYNSKVTRSYVDEIRGVDSSYQIRKLVYRNLVHEVGRSDLPGRPILYSVTDEFLDYLGIKSLDELPKLQTLVSVTGCVIRIRMDPVQLLDIFLKKFEFHL